MFLEQGIKPENKFWKYLVGSVLVIIGSAIGNIPLFAAAFAKSFIENTPVPTTDQTIMKAFDSNTTLFLLLLSFVFAIGSLFFVIKYLHRQSILSVTTGRKKIDWRRVMFSFSIWGIYTVVSTGIAYLMYPEDFVINFRPVPFAILLIIATVMLPIQTSTEEYIFRGYLMQGFANLSRNRWFPLVMTAVIFGTLHIFNPEVAKMGYVSLVYYIGTGLFLGIITLMDDGIELALGFHAANNLVGALLLTSDWTVFQTDSILKDVSEPAAGADVVFPVAIIFPILLFIFAKKYNWHGWTAKLTGKLTINSQP